MLVSFKNLITDDIKAFTKENKNDLVDLYLSNIKNSDESVIKLIVFYIIILTLSILITNLLKKLIYVFE